MADTGKRDGKRGGGSNLIWALPTLAVLIVVMLFVTDVFGAENATEVFERLCDVFFVPGVLLASFGGLSFVAAKGGFDTVTYLFTNFALHSLMPTKQKKKYDSYYDYKTAKDERGRMWFPQVLIIGGASIAVSVVMLIVSVCV